MVNITCSRFLFFVLIFPVYSDPINSCLYFIMMFRTGVRLEGHLCASNVDPFIIIQDIQDILNVYIY